MNFPNFLLVFSSLLGRNDEKNGTWNSASKINQTVVAEIDLNPITNDSSIPNDIIATTFSSKEIFQPQANSCREISTTPYIPHGDLRTRTCMCDENCPTYNDCCNDSIHLDSFTSPRIHFTCTNTPLNGNIYMVDKCPIEFIDLETIYKCETPIVSRTMHDISLILPVTSSKNITYSNSFCAICNNETQFEVWDPALYYELEKVNDRVISNESVKLMDKIYFNQSIILSNLRVENGTSYKSQFNNLTYKCSILMIMPIHLRSSVRYCRSNESILVGNYQNESFSETCPDNVIKLDRNNLPENLIIRETKPPDFSLELRNKINTHIKTCVYAVAETGDLCQENSFFLRDIDVVFMKNEQIFVKKYNITFDQTEYSNETVLKDAIYVCGTELPNPKRIQNAIKVFLSRSSSCLIILLLIMNANKKKLQSLSDKMTYAYCVTMVLVYGAFEMHRHPRWCLFTEEAMHYFFLSHFVWFLAMSYELWNVICRLSVKFQSTTGKSHTKRFIIYCLICWITPLPVIPLTMYYRRFVNIPTNCPSIPGYKIRKPCLTIPESPIGMYVFFINSVIICVNVLLFVHVCYHIYLTKRRNVKSTSHNNYFELFVKLALTMDLQWFFYLFSFSDIEALKVVNTMLNASHGLITFLAHGVKKSTFVNLYKKYKSYFDIVQKLRNTIGQLFGEVKRASFLKRNSVEPSTQHTGVDLLSNV